jgi:hypothetical protein
MIEEVCTPRASRWKKLFVDGSMHLAALKGILKVRFHVLGDKNQAKTRIRVRRP